MTTLVEPPSVPADAPVGPPLGGTAATGFAPPVPVATLSADLMPDEIVVKRRLGYLKRRLVFVMVALVALVVLGDLLVRQQTNGAQGALASENNQISTLTRQLNGFNGMLRVQGETETIQTQLVGVMGNDVSWSQLMDQLAGPAPTGLKLTSIAAQVDDPNSTTGSAPDPTSIIVPDAVGTVTLTGSAQSWSQVATYVRGLSSTKGFTAVNPSTVSRQATGSSGALTFTVTLDLTSAALSNRYAAPTTGATGATGATGTAGTAGTAAPADSQSGAAGTGPSSAATSHTTNSRSAANVVGNSTKRKSTNAPAKKSRRSQHHVTSRHRKATGRHTSVGAASGQGQNTQESS